MLDGNISIHIENKFNLNHFNNYVYFSKGFDVGLIIQPVDNANHNLLN